MATFTIHEKPRDQALKSPLDSQKETDAKQSLCRSEVEKNSAFLIQEGEFSSCSIQFSPELTDRLAILPTLQSNWDDDGADPIEPELIPLVREVLCHLLRHLPEPFLSASPGGGIDLSWQDRALFASFWKSKLSLFNGRTCRSETHSYSVANEEATKISDLIRQWVEVSDSTQAQ